MTADQYAFLVLLAAITATSALYLAVESAWARIQQWRWDRHVARAVAVASNQGEPIYARLAAERPEVAAVMSADWGRWEKEVAGDG